MVHLQADPCGNETQRDKARNKALQRVGRSCSSPVEIMTVSDGFPAWLKAGVEPQTRMMMGAFDFTPLGIMQRATRHYRRKIAANRARLTRR